VPAGATLLNSVAQVSLSHREGTGAA
jgi:hypothetical protein